MVGLRFCEKLIELDVDRRFELHIFCEEDVVAYNRVNLTSWFTHRAVKTLIIQHPEWYTAQNITIIMSKATHIDTTAKIVTGENGMSVPYDHCILATGSEAFMPPIIGKELKGVHVYRTVKDLELIVASAKDKKAGVVIGGGLLGLEAAKACVDLGLKTTVIERNPCLLNRQLDMEGAQLLQNEMSKIGVMCRVNANIRRFVGQDVNGQELDSVTQVIVDDEERVDADVVVVAAGIKPRDELAKASGILTHPRGGVLVDDELKTSAEGVWAIGECVVHGGMVYGLVAPGYEMAETVAINLVNGPQRTFTGADMSTKLKLLGVHVASFGDYFADPEICSPLVYRDPFAGIYKRLLFTKDGTKLLGGILVGDTSDYTRFLSFSKSGKVLPSPPGELILGKKADESNDDLPDDAQVCSCNNVLKKDIADAVSKKGCCSIADVKTCTKAGTGCGGCLPLVTDIFNAEMKKSGKVVEVFLCEHFKYSRRELFDIVKVRKIRTFKEAMRSCGTGGNGCEICKPTFASIFASLWNDHILVKPHAPLQDTNDRYLANIQRGGSYSVVPRIPGGEITPDKLSVIGAVASKYGLYTKITGGQRIDLFGAPKHLLPSIWEELVKAGFESGHAYGKALRTVKSCVGSTWCRYGIGDSVGLAVRVENRYKGIRSPHKLKGGVSGCIRECAEAQSKDFGLIATDKGYNLYVCGNGGSSPKHAVLLAGDVSEEMVIKYLDRFLMFYITTADRLQRTARWLEKLEGGIDYLRSVVVDDRLGIGEELEMQMQYLVDTYQCEWKTVVEDPVRRAEFAQFVNTPENEVVIDTITERGQRRPANWPKKVEKLPLPVFTKPAQPTVSKEEEWIRVGSVTDFPEEGGATVKYGQTQLAVFRMEIDGETKWFATQNMCPHKRAFVLSGSLTGTQKSIPKISCPNHKKNFSLVDGSCLSGEDYSVRTFSVKADDKGVWLLLPSVETLDAELGTGLWMIREGDDVKADGGIEIVNSGCATGCGKKELEW
ncbi:nitrite reductase [NAD(P)H], large subunit [Spizellomyces punctatus DAOM BR117]|uniref:Nitrite reductase [NAD(P)H] n=1 Tax=Spizellomyces punctatus (strain DAOM BR117) TaxID=645134 RepID=A0A0L0H5D4_SPIPD|nr:nitrite reductase [NAD(P)H], large subunit [Spizellomyces punctatus DAOM BR117]KNC96715.1 nitrite reductase [NAD(P)H], large subunit [Spizellomyces punctatus DAOM BR117]|eukprot:XP_016604755.1 nitrite reductase [NAD(P)H], large subunit [Spizellomyces punctatus DAOM BR117]